MNNNTNDFLPPTYEAPKGGGAYMKFQQGENRFRILSKPIIGWLDWDDKKPLRFQMNAKPAKPIDPAKPVKHFWAFVVWDYTDSKIKILEVTQSTIQQAIQSLSRDKDWGAPFGYDIKVYKSGEMLNTEYSVNPVPHKPVSAEIQEAYMAKPVNLDALFSGEDPFNVVPTAAVPDKLPF